MMPRKTSFMYVIILLIAGLMFSGCSALFPPPTKKTTMPDGTVIEEPLPQTAGGFFESKNLLNFYTMEANRVDKHAAVVESKIAAIQANAISVQANAATPTEKLMASVITSMQLAAIPTAPPPSGLQAPKTMVDVVDGDLLDWTKLYLTYKQSKKKTADNSGNSIVGNGNIINYMSPESFNPSYDLGEGAVGTWEGNNYTLSDDSKSDSTSTYSLF